MSRVLLVLSIFCFAFGITDAQTKPPSSQLCTRDNALDTAKQQVLQSRTFDNVVQRIGVLVRAGDLLWPHDQEKALAALMEAFDLAVQDYKEHGDQIKRTSDSRFAAVISVPDQRFKVITALARRDPARARKLSEQMLKDAAHDVTDKSSTTEESKRRNAEKLLVVADALTTTDLPGALTFARLSFQYPATLYLPMFLYRLAKVDRQAADRFYTDALVAYAKTPMDQFLYLSAYPFGATREFGNMPSYMIYNVPDDYSPNLAMERAFMQVLLARAEGALSLGVDQATDRPYPDQAQMWLALTRLEKQLQENLPDLAEVSARVKDKLFAMLNPNLQQMVDGQIASDNAPKRSFDEQIEWAEKQKDPGRRDQLLSSAVTTSSKDQPVEKVLSVIDKISEASVRDSLLNWFYYFRAQALIASKDLIEAKKFAEKVTELDQRAYLFTRIAEESLKSDEDQTVARQVLEEVTQAVNNAPKTVVSARALLALAHLYAKFDTNRGVEVLSNAVRTINALESPDFSQQYVIMKIEGKTFGSFASFSTPGFNPENAFREMGKLDFDGSLIQAANFSDKSLRALTTLAVIEPCFTAKKGR